MSSFLAAVIVLFWIVGFFIFPLWFAVYTIIISYLSMMWAFAREDNL